MTTPKKKYISISEYIDIDTGEIITKSLYQREYTKTNYNKTYEYNEKYTIIKHTTECKHNNQTKLWD